MTRKFRRVIPLFLALLMVLSLSVYAKNDLLKTVIAEAPTVEKVGVASNPVSTLDLIGGYAVDEDGNWVPGYFVWGNPDFAMEPGIHEVSVRFIPFWNMFYAESTCTVKVHAYKLNLTVRRTPTVEGKLAVNKSVSELELKDGEAVNHFDKERPAIAGHFEFVDPDQKFDKAGTYEVPVVFKPDNDKLYNDATVTYKRDANRNFKDAYVSITVE